MPKQKKQKKPKVTAAANNPAALNVQIQRKRRRQSYWAGAIVIAVFVIFVAIQMLSYMNTDYVVQRTAEQTVSSSSQYIPADKENVSWLTGLIEMVDVLDEEPERMLPSHWKFTDRNGSVGFTKTVCLLMGGLLICIIGVSYVDMERHMHDLKGKECGSAQWNNDFKSFNNVYRNPEDSQNTILSQDVFLSMNGRKTQRNSHVLVVGGSGAGKSRYFVKPNVLQMNSNMVITDPSGELLQSLGECLRKNGYNIKVFNLEEKDKTCCYNPFHYIRDEEGVKMMINCLIQNTTPPDNKKGEKFWEDCESLLLQSLSFYLLQHRPVEEQNFDSVVKLLSWAFVDENNPNAQSRLDRIFLRGNAEGDNRELRKYKTESHYINSEGAEVMNTDCKSIEEMDPNDIGLRLYKQFKQGAGKTLKSILISVNVRLQNFTLPKISAMTNTDNIHLEDLSGKPNAVIRGADKRKVSDDSNVEPQKQALFIIIPSADDTFNFLAAMMYSQLFELAEYIATTQCKKQALPVHLRFLLDEFANIGTIPQFNKKLSTIRKFNISCAVILQSLSQLKAMYKDDWETIVGNCDSYVFLGSTEQTTLEDVEKKLGKQTITTQNHSQNVGSKGGGGNSYQQTARSLLTADELGHMPNNMSVVMIRGENPFYTPKYDYLAHPRYPETGDADESQIFVNPYHNTVNSGKTLDEKIAELVDDGQLIKAYDSIEDLLDAVPNWVDYPNIYAQFRIARASFKKITVAPVDQKPADNPAVQIEDADEGDAQEKIYMPPEHDNGYKLWDDDLDEMDFNEAFKSIENETKE